MATIDGSKAALLGGGVALLSALAVGASIMMPAGTAAPPVIATPPAMAAEPVVEAAAVTAPPATITGWMPYWENDASLAAVAKAGDNMTEVSPFWYDIVADGKKIKLNAHALSGPLSREETTQALKQDGLVVIPTITDNAPANLLSANLRTSKQRRALATQIVKLVNSGGYDGIDLDWEKFAFEDGSTTWKTTRERWVKFVALLSKRLHAQNKILSVTTPPMTGSSEGYWVYDWSAISPHIDRLRIMTYDYSFTYPGAIGPIWWAERTLKYADLVMEPSKVQLGVAAYGRNWVTKVDGLCPSDANVSRTTVSPRQASRLAKETGAKVKWDSESAEATFTYSRTYKSGSLKCKVTREVWYPTSKSLNQRMKLAEQFGTAGVAVWPLGDTPTAFLRR